MSIRKNLIATIAIMFVLSVIIFGGQEPPSKRDFGPPSGKERDGKERGGDFGRGQRPDRPFPSDPGMSILGPGMRFDAKVVKGAPYSATVTTESTQTLSNGTRITRKTTASVYRDSEGRTRREMTLDGIGPFGAANEPARLIFINDPVAGVHYNLDPRNHIARKSTSPQGNRPPPHRSHPAEERRAEARPTGGKTESLGKQVIEGVEAEGVRSVITIPEGQIGNDRPIEIVSERWDSPALQTVVLSKHNDPRFGETIYRLTNINRAEPARSLFEAPSDYKIQEGGRGGFFGGPPTQRMKKPHDR
ncbi:MAG: hypothetical protein ACREAM_25420 [Blastocatellia bacterium]